MRARIILRLLLTGLLGASVASAQAPLRSAGGNACEYGVAMAFTGDLARAESAFVWVLASSPGDSRALTNLGNLNLMKGDPDVALAFYQRAEESDTTDAGIVLNQATALLLLGEEDAASERASVATRRAGGVRQAARLLGLRTADEDVPKAAAGVRVSQEEILRLLKAASVGVPSDSTRSRAGATKEGASRRHRGPVWRSAAARAGDQEAASVLYWKR